MSYRNHILTILSLCSLLLRASASAETLPDATTPSTSRPVLSITLRGGETVGDNQVQRAFLTIGTNQIAFIVPTGFRMDASSGEKIVLSDNTGNYFITVRVTGAAPNGAEPQAFFQNQALTRFPGARISNQFGTFAAGHSGPAFDLAWINSNGAAQSARIAFVSSPAGTLEFSVLSRTVNFGDAQIYLTVLMSSVCSNETGKLLIKPQPDNS
jgi:hypothetical protein